MVLMIEELCRKNNGIYNEVMWGQRNFKYLQPSAYTRRATTYVDRQFQLKYTRYILGMAIVSAVVFLLPALYFSNQNYVIFYQLADLLSPQLTSYIAKERIGFNVVFMAAFIGNAVFWIIFSKKMTAKIAGPAKILRNHIRLLSRGDFTMKPIRLRESDEFKELINTYNYFYALLQAQNKKELEELEAVHASIANPLAHELIGRMIHERALRLNQNLASSTFSNGEPPSASLYSRHVS